MSEAVREKAQGVRIRRARQSEAARLSALALASKAVWGYDAQFLGRCRAELTVSVDYIASQPAYVAEADGRTAGFYGLSLAGGGASLDYLFVDPQQLRRGLGEALWRHALGVARSLGAGALLIEADPNAEAFYRRMGAQRVGAVASGSIPGRELPLLRCAPLGEQR